ncbi:hypothetical protein [Coralliovum pocilloporae]|uniref:hypothetical protein n=1 Tax=Coralliovum pocilloporae TaxID=3066369 RepID=UPI0033078210
MWLALSAIVIVGLALNAAGLVLVNIAMAIVFAGCSAFLAWRVRVVENLLCGHPGGPEMRRFLIVEAFSALAMLLVGFLLLMMASFRVFSEGYPVFG